MAEEKKKSITTRGGDQGTTSLFDGTRVLKAALRPEVYGTLDEASAFIGLARCTTAVASNREILKRIQSLIYLVNAELACPPESKEKLHKRFEADHQKWLEEQAAGTEAVLDLQPKFILYGGTEASAILDVARAVVRRAERAFTALAREAPMENPHIGPFLNRLSDFLYLLARLEDRAGGATPQHPEP